MASSKNKKSAALATVSGNQVLASPAIPVEHKLTRSEIIDIIIEDAYAGMRKQLEEVKAEIATTRNIPFKEIHFTSPEARFSFHGGRARVDDAEIKQTPFVKARIAKLEELEKRMRAIESAMSDITYNRTRAKNEILKRFLMSSPEGMQVMEFVKKSGASMTEQLLKAAHAVSEGAK